ncbi:hypothetical protein [Xanthomonas axonopodis]|uniref:hypothetical protein n=1 Tax=Xanthomonas axonopodis TaxID=53413 RepID=UPI0015520A8E|nr:hypothetical protein [Xanthomonas axonopodis]
MVDTGSRITCRLGQCAIRHVGGALRLRERHGPLRNAAVARLLLLQLLLELLRCGCSGRGTGCSFLACGAVGLQAAGGTGQATLHGHQRADDFRLRAVEPLQLGDDRAGTETNAVKRAAKAITQHHGRAVDRARHRLEVALQPIR